MPSLNGNFREHMLTGGLFILPFIILLLINPGILVIFGIDPAKLIYYAETYSKFHPGLFMSAIITFVVMISIIIGFVFELFGSLAFRVEATILYDMLTKNRQICFLIKRYNLLDEGAEKYLSENNFKHILKCRKIAGKIESFLVLHYTENRSYTQNEILLRNMSSLRIARGVSWLAVHVFFINCLALYMGLLRDIDIYSVGVILYVAAPIIILFVIFFLVDKFTRMYQIDQAPLIQKRHIFLRAFISFLVLVIDCIILLIIFVLHLSDEDFVKLHMNTILSDTILSFSMLFLAIFLFGIIYATTTKAYSNHIQTLFDLIQVQRRTRKTCSKCESER